MGHRSGPHRPAPPDLRAYRRLWFARAISQVGDVAQFTTLALLLVALTGSGLGVSGAVLAEIAPVLLLAPRVLADVVGVRAVYVLGGLLLLSAAAVGSVAARRAGPT